LQTIWPKMMSGEDSHHKRKLMSDENENKSKEIPAFLAAFL